MKEDIIKRIIDKLYDYEGSEFYGADLAYSLFESENIDGSFTYNSYEAKEWIRDNFDEIGEVYEELVCNLGAEYMGKFNAFDNPEGFMVIIILEAANYLLGRCEFVENNWDDEIFLDKENIKTIESQLNALNNGRSIYA